MEPGDRKSENYIHAAIRREAREELGIDVRVIREIGDFTVDDIMFHVAYVDSWSGDIPSEL